MCNDAHIGWQSNRDRYWDIYYINSTDKLAPFRHETQITNTESNSLKPSLSVNRNGRRMVAWHDNRETNFGIYSARSLEGYDCNQEECERKMIEELVVINYGSTIYPEELNNQHHNMIRTPE